MALDAKKSFGVRMSEDIYPLTNLDETLYAWEILYVSILITQIIFTPNIIKIEAK